MIISVYNRPGKRKEDEIKLFEELEVVMGRFRSKYKRGEIIVVGDLNKTIEQLKRMRKECSGIERLLEMSWGVVGKTSIKRVGTDNVENVQIDHMFSERSTKWVKKTEPGEFGTDHSLIVGDVMIL